MKSLLVGTGCYLCKVYNYHDGIVLDGWNGFGVDHVDWCDP
jgi:hypothetical protein